MEYKLSLIDYSAYMKDENTYGTANMTSDALERLAGLV